MNVILVYETDAWLSYSSQNLIAVCTSYEDAVTLALQHAKNNWGVKSFEDIDEDDYDQDADYIENMQDALVGRRQYNGNGFGYYMDEVETDRML